MKHNPAHHHVMPISRAVSQLLTFTVAVAALMTVNHIRADDIDYVLTTQNDPVKPGHVLEFDATVRNLSASSQSVTLNFIVPEFTTYFGAPAGTAEFYSFGTLLAGESKTDQLRFVVVGSGIVPPRRHR
jgi:hypothetical protein